MASDADDLKIRLERIADLSSRYRTAQTELENARRLAEQAKREADSTTAPVQPNRPSKKRRA